MMGNEPVDQATIFTIGHSNHGLEKFIALLKDNLIEIVVDIRSRPYSRFASRFNKASIKDTLHEHGVRYLYLGDRLGGKPDDSRFYDSEGHVVYAYIAETPGFRDGIERLVRGSIQFRIALMCSEENPLNCHRYHLVSRSLEKRGIQVVHVRGDGMLQSQEVLSRAREEDNQVEKQLNLFGPNNKNISRD